MSHSKEHEKLHRIEYCKIFGIQIFRWQINAGMYKKSSHYYDGIDTTMALTRSSKRMKLRASTTATPEEGAEER